MAMSKQPRRNPGGESQHHHAEQEIIKTATIYPAQATANHHSAPAAAKVQKKIKPNGCGGDTREVTRGKRKLKKLPNPNHHIGLLQTHVAAMRIAGDQGNSGRYIHLGSPSRRRKIAHSDPVRWKIKSHRAGGRNSSKRGVNAPNINIAIHHVAPALTPAPAPAINNPVVTVSSSTDQLQNSRSAGAPAQLDPVVFEPGFLSWDQVEMPDEANRRNSDIFLYPSVDMLEEIN